MVSMPAYRRRLVDDLIAALLTELPAIFVVGPRAAGKTTTAARHAKTVVRLDREAEAVAFRADPDAALRDLAEPVLLDEWQVVPDVLGAVKRSVDRDPRPGRFLITGSVRSELEGDLWPGTGRLVRIAMYGMTMAEQLGRDNQPLLIDRILRGEPLLPAAHSPDLRGYLELALRGGFPEPALHLGAAARERWLESYVDHLVTRDAPQVDAGRSPARLRRYLEAYALNTAGTADDRTLYDAAGINRRTAITYERLLGNLLVVEAIPAWTSNRLKRLVLSPKRYVLDPALAGALLRLDVPGALRHGDLLGRLLDTFVAAQLRPELVVSDSRPRLYHVRQQHGRYEVDLLAEVAAGDVVAIEVKATSAPGPDDARHLSWLRDQIGAGFRAGVVLHTGPRAFRLADRIVAAPISTFWA